ncbi:hypothetical protein [Loktanella sp. Alg231-35]|uniref:hypothetical protein n=1 Tax=Loktanella sp. Alg231-35 TaxID=1922220 RepID=UPI001F3DE86D|nr:hypothetical protein [Loktanella sp. Alg231-35]
MSILVLLTACGANPFVPPKANPIIIDRTPDEGDYTQTVATTAERRLVLVRQVGTDEQLRLRNANIHINEGFCAEPSPDAIEAIAATFELSASNTAAANSQEAQFGQALASSAALGTKRTQGLQFYRDTIFGLCQARMNGFMSNAELKTQLRFAREAAVRLMLAEINSTGFSTPPTVNVTVAAPEISSQTSSAPAQ